MIKKSGIIGRFIGVQLIVHRGWLSAVPYGLLMTLLFRQFLQNRTDTAGTANLLSAGNVLVYMFWGGDFSLARDYIPIRWIFCLSMMSFPVIGSCSDRSHFFGQMLLKSESRVNWWAASLLYALISSTLYLLLMLASIAVSADILGGSPGFHISVEVLKAMEPESDGPMGLSCIPERVPDTVWKCMWMPLLVVLVLNVAEMTLEVVLTYYGAFMVRVSFLLISAFFPIEYLAGNGAMLARCSTLRSGGFSSKHLSIGCLMLLVAAVYWGRRWMAELDFFGTKSMG